MRREIMGDYLGRQVNLIILDELSEIHQVNVACSLILILLCKSNWRKDDFRSAVEVIALKQVLGITVAGERVDDSFSIMLDTLGSLPGPHIMTGISRELNMKSVVENFMVATYPSEERFDKWQSYSFIIVGNDASATSLREAIKSKHSLVAVPSNSGV
jgi:hypothetical protein